MQHLGTVLQQRAAERPDAPAFRFVDSRGHERGMLTYGGLLAAAQSLADRLAAECASGDRVAILIPPGLDYVVAVWGCLLANVVAVPAYPPRLRREDPRVARLLQHASVSHTVVHDNNGLTIRHIGAFAEQRAPSPQGLAVLQYTSGSTAEPRGVMLTHAQLLAHAELLQEAVRHHPGETAVFWIPPYHDMGLIGGVLHPVYTGTTSVLMAPASFVQRPLLWLELLSRYGAVSSAAPDSAYRLVAERIEAQDVARLDLSAWRIAFNGSEPLRPGTMDAFRRTFAAAGLRPSVFVPCYGLAEATLFVSGGHVAPSAADTSMMVPSGPVAPRTTVRIVQADGQTVCAPGTEGEIWVQGPQVAAGYWNDPDATQLRFGAMLNGHDGTWLRTGDLGLMRDGQLVITGRQSDLLIVQGRNVHPQDLEQAAASAHPAIRRDHRCATKDRTPARRSCT